jgi:hypothetical protein
MLTARALAVLVLVFYACAAPPLRRSPDPRPGPFSSSQIKPPPSTIPALAPLPRDETRLAAQKSYFRALEKGIPISKPGALDVGASAKPVAAGVRDLRAGALPSLVLPLTRGQQVTLETRRLSSGADTVLHLLRREAADVEVAFDDDGGTSPGASRIRFTAAEPGTYVVLVRAYAAPDDGRCDVLVDGAVRLEQVKFGGAALPVGGGVRLDTVLLNDGQGPIGASQEPWPPSPRAATDTVLLLLDPESGRLVALDDDSGVELGSRVTVPPGTASLAVVGALDGAAEGVTRLVVSDAEDSDGDGLGDQLERELCLCADRSATTCGFDCGQVVTPQDSDGDGLGDAEELRGVDHQLFPQLLPRWGADPGHKDLFVEIDVADWIDSKVSPPEHHRGRTLATADAHAAARVFARLTEMRNPDGREGIDLHLDLGHACGNLPSGIDGVCGDLCAWGRDGERRCGRSTHPGPPTPRLETLSAGRRHLFHIAISDCLVAGSAPGAPSDHLEFDCDRFSAMVHELGHNLGIARHYGTLETGGGNCKPNYPSLMNYAYSDRFAGGREVRFSDGSLVGAGDLSPTDLDETVPYGGEDRDVAWLATRPFYFALRDCRSPGRGCKVDWNRDGRLDPSVRAFLSPMPNYGWICENLHGNTLSTENIEGLEASSGPAAAELLRERSGGGQPGLSLHVVAPAVNDAGDGATLHVNHTFNPVDGGWQGWVPVPGPPLRPDTQPAAIVLPDGEGVDRLHILACSGGEAPILHATLDRRGALTALQAVPGQPSGLRARDVSVARLGADLALLVRDDSPSGGDRVYLTRRTPAGWTKTFVQVTAEADPLRSTVTPALSAGPDGRVYVVTGDPDPPPGTGLYGRLHLFSGATPEQLEDEELSGVSFEDGTPGLEHVTWSRPALAFVAHRDGKGQPLSEGRGTLALWWNRGTRTRHLSTWGRLDEGGADFSLGRWHHYEAMGYTDAIAGSAPALLVRADGRLSAFIGQADFSPRLVRHVPFADGVPDALTLRDFDDRKPIRESLCTSLNWECKERCKRLTDPCQGGSKTQAATETHCALPRWGDPP